jgi:beta-lactamase regulating signal transducer with metallopeptidase domain
LLDPDALAAALAHERAHVRHRDPFRIWLAQIATDLQGLGPFARRRLDAWLESLEIARDEDARSEGVRGEDLAAAVLAVAKMSAPATGAVAGLTGTQASLASRVRRLLDPLPVLYRRRSVVLPLMILIALGVSIGVGVRCGDSVLRALPFIGA